MTALSYQARGAIKDEGVTIAGYVRHWFTDGKWHGDSCGCPDDRCIGFHHGGPHDCGCLAVTLGEYVRAVRTAGPIR
jgi:hypothetical protein